jgi:hypothetical protein
MYGLPLRLLNTIGRDRFIVLAWRNFGLPRGNNWMHMICSKSFVNFSLVRLAVILHALAVMIQLGPALQFKTRVMCRERGGVIFTCEAC